MFNNETNIKLYINFIFVIDIKYIDYEIPNKKYLCLYINGNNYY